MSESVWQWWPWISLFIFALLVTLIFRLTWGPFSPKEQIESGIIGIWMMLIISLIVGASICIIITNYWV